MAEFIVGSWDAKYAFSDERAYAASQVVEAMDADVLAIQRFARNRDGADKAYPLLEELGYFGAFASPIASLYTPATSMWTRIGGDIETIWLGGYRCHKVLLDDPNIEVYGLDFLNVRMPSRLRSMGSLCQILESSEEPSVVVGNFFAPYPEDPGINALKSAGEKHKSPHRDDRERRIHREMANTFGWNEDTTLEQLIARGFHDADPDMRPTTIDTSALYKFQLDHIMVSAGVVAEGFTIHDLPSVGERPISDHLPITAGIAQL